LPAWTSGFFRHSSQNIGEVHSFDLPLIPITATTLTFGEQDFPLPQRNLNVLAENKYGMWCVLSEPSQKKDAENNFHLYDL
jgi:hypothetical protein